MRIVEDSPRRLRLRNRSWLVPGICFAVALFVAGMVAGGRAPRSMLTPGGVFAAIGLLFVRGADVPFDRSARTVTLRRFSVFGMRTVRLAFSDIRDVRVDTDALATPQHRPICE